MDLTIATVVAVLALLFGWYQGRMGRGSIRVDCDLSRHDLRLLITSVTPLEVELTRVVIAGSRHPFLSRFVTLVGGGLHGRWFAFSRYHYDRFEATIFHAGEDVYSVGNAKREQKKRKKKRVAADEVTQTLRPYASKSWSYSLYSDPLTWAHREIVEILRTEGSTLKVRARVSFIGHPQRVAMSRSTRASRY